MDASTIQWLINAILVPIIVYQFKKMDSQSRRITELQKEHSKFETHVANEFARKDSMEKVQEKLEMILEKVTRTETLVEERHRVSTNCAPAAPAARKRR